MEKKMEMNNASSRMAQVGNDKMNKLTQPVVALFYRTVEYSSSIEVKVVKRFHENMYVYE
jgi:hypothetical protein